jgi:hypothetical protein
MRGVAMNEDDRMFLAIRLLGALGGFFGGGVGGTILTVGLIMITDYSFGLKTIWPGTLAGAFVGALLGFIFPRIGRMLMEIGQFFP